MRYAELLSEAVNKRPWVFYHGTKSAAFDRFDPKTAAKGKQFWNPLGHALYCTNNPHFAANFGPNVYKVVIPPGSTYRRITLREWQRLGRSLVMRALRRAFTMIGENLDEWENGVRPKLPQSPSKMTRDQIISALLQVYGRYADEAKVRTAAAGKSDSELRDILKVQWRNLPRERSKQKADAIFRFKVGVAKMIDTLDPYTSLYESVAGLETEPAFPDKLVDAYTEALPEVSTQWFGRYDFVVFTKTNDPIGFSDEESTWEVLVFNPALQKVQPVGDTGLT